MSRVILRRAALTLTALGLAPGAAHLLEMPVKLHYSASMYAEVTRTLYAWYGVLGGTTQVTAVLAVGALAYFERHTPRAGMTLAATLALGVSVVLWASIVAPVNAAWADALGTGDHVAVYAELRARWEFGHLAAFMASASGWLGLVTSTTRALP